MLDHLIIGIYLLAILMYGVYNRSKTLGMRNYGKIDLKIQNKFFLILATIFTNSVGGGSVFGLSERVFAQDLSYVYALGLTVLVDILVASVIVKKIAQHYGVISIGEIMARHYGKFGRVFTGISATFVSFGYVAIQISVSSRIFQNILHINYVEGVILSYLVVITYTAIGGLRSIIVMNFVQFFAIIIFLPIVSIVGLYKIGFANFIASVPVAKYDLSILWQDSLQLFLSFALMGFYPGFIQRSFMTKDYKQTRNAIYAKSLIYVLFLAVIAMNGLLSYCHNPAADSNLALLTFIDEMLPAALKGLVTVGLLAAVMSTADSELNIASISLTNDVFGPLFKVRDSKILLLFTQIATLLIGSFAIFLALKFNNTVDLVLFVAGFWLPIMVIPLIASLYDIAISKLGLAIAALCGASSFALWQIYFTDSSKIKSAFVGLLANLSVFVLFAAIGYIYKSLSINENNK